MFELGDRFTDVGSMSRSNKYGDYMVGDGSGCEGFGQGHVDYSAKIRPNGVKFQNCLAAVGGE